MSIIQLGEILSPVSATRAGGRLYPILSMTMHEGLIPQQQKFKKSIASKDLSNYKVIEQGQLVVGFPIDEGVLSFQNYSEKALVSPAYGVWEIRDPNGVDSDYLEKFLRSPIALSYYRAKLRGSTARRRSLPLADFKAMPVPLPDISEQRRIADILDKVDALRTKRREAIAHLDTLSQSIFHEMFGHTEYVSTPMSDLVDSVQLGLVRASTEFGENFEIPYVRMDAISASGQFLVNKVQRTNATESEMEKYELLDGDFLMNTRNSRELVGKSTIVRSLGRGLFNNNLLRIRFNAKAVPDYVAAFMLTDSGRRQLELRKSGTTNVFAMYQRDYLAIEVSCPPKDLQQKFANRVSVIERQKAANFKELIELESLFSSLQSQAFKGKL